MTDYKPDEIIIENWGRLQVVINGVDLTWWNNVPVIVNEWRKREPFGDVSCTLFFPQITPFESESIYTTGEAVSGDFPFVKFDNVEINLIDDEDNYIRPLFEGLVVSFTDDTSSSSTGITVECVGAMYQADYMKKAPRFSDGALDIGTAIAFEMNARIENYGLRLVPVSIYSWTNIPSRSRGSWGNLLTGWVQELLGIAYASTIFDAEEFAAKVTTIEADEYSGLQCIGTLGTQLSLTSPESRRNWEKIPFYGSIMYIIKYARGLARLAGLSGESEEIADMTQRPQGDGYWYVNKGGRVFVLGEAEHFGEAYVFSFVENIVAIQSTPSGEGYWLLGQNGQVLPYGDAPGLGYGDPLAPIAGYDDYYIDIQSTPSGNGYWLVSRMGRTQAFGDATAMGNAAWPLPTTGSVNDDNTGRFYRDSALNDAADGMWIVGENGWVSTHGNADTHSQVNIGAYMAAVSIAANSDDEYVIMREDGTLYPTSGHWASNSSLTDQKQTFAKDLRSNTDTWPDVYQFTLVKEDNRRPVIQVKNEWNKHWHITVGQPGVAHSLTRDWTQSPNVYFGEGVSADNCRWRNTKYPNLRQDTGAIWPGYYISISLNTTADGVLQWERAMAERGSPVIVNGIYDYADATACRDFQARSGLEVDGVVGPQTWNATFGVGYNQGSVEGAFIAPIAQAYFSEPFLFNAHGQILGDNPDYDPRIIRIETYDNYGENISKRDGEISALARMKREAEVGYYGTITLTSDPNEGSRFDIKPGENIVYTGYRTPEGINYTDSVKFHISEVAVDMTSLTVTLTVDTQARDAGTIAQMIERDREAFAPGPARIRTRYASTGKTSEDRISVWDCESGAGFIPRLGIGAGVWQVVKIPMGEYGQVVQTYFKTDIPAVIGVGIFDVGVNASDLQAIGNPRDTENYWKLFSEETGLVVAWGEPDQMGGYWPGRNSDDNELTGVLMDKASWNFWTTDTPWLYVAMWVDRTTYIQGRLYPGMEAPGVRPMVSSLADPVLRELPGPEYFITDLLD